MIYMEETHSSSQSKGYLALIRENNNFRNLWFGQIVSLLGDWFNLIASASLVGKLSGSGAAIGALFIIRMLAPFLISPFAGVWSDRYNRKKILISTDILRGFALFGFLLVKEPGDLWLLYSLTAFQLALSGIFFPTRIAILPDIVSKKELGTANAISSATWSVMLAVGAALGGISTGIWGIYQSFVIDAFTFFFSALILSRVIYQPPSTEPGKDTSLSAALREYITGIKFLRDNKDLLIIASLKGWRGVFVSGPFQIAQVIIAEQVFSIGEGGGISLGLMYAAVGLGTGVGPIIARRFTGDNPKLLRRAITISFAISAAGLATIAPLSTFGLVLFGTLWRGVGVGINWVFSNQLLLQLAPEKVRGRVFSNEFAFLTLMNAFGAAAGGWTLDFTNLGPAGILRWTAGLSLIPGLFWWLWLKRGSIPNSN